MLPRLQRHQIDRLATSADQRLQDNDEKTNDKMDFKEMCLKRQACRKYSDQPVEKEKLDYILECAQLAPSAVNRQPWKMYLLQSEEAIQKAVSCYARDWAKTAPMFILCCIKHDEEWVRGCDGKPHGIVDISILAEHICLAATEVGLDTCWICNFDVEKLTGLFNLPQNEEAAVLIPVGYSADPHREKTRKELSQIVEVL